MHVFSPLYLPCVCSINFNLCAVYILHHLFLEQIIKVESKCRYLSDSFFGYHKSNATKYNWVWVCVCVRVMYIVR